MMNQNKSILEGRNLICPRCKRSQDILTYVPLMEIEEFRSQTTPVYKCGSCKWIFALSDNLIFEVLSGRLAVVSTESES